MRRAVWLGSVVIAATFACLPLRAQTADDPLRIYAATIIISPPLKSPFPANGIYLGGGAVITAAHAIGRWAFLKNPSVIISGQTLPARVIREGSFAETDLALLSVDERRLPLGLGLRRNPLCKQPPIVGESVIVVAAQQTGKSKIMSPQFIDAELREKYSTLITDLAGTSGSGVFNARRWCLFGIISQRIQKFDYHTEGGAVVAEPAGFAGYFIPVPQIADFIPAEFRF